MIEVLLSCALGALLLSGLMQLYLSSKYIFAMQEALAHIQENGRFAIHLLSTHIHMAGYAGCEDEKNPVHQETAIKGYHSQLPDYLAGAVLAGTDVITVNECDWKEGKFMLLEKSYYIANSNRKNKMHQSIYSLYEKSPEGNRQELISDVENMAILYGIGDEANKNIQNYLTADAVQDWTKVKSVKLALLLNSEEAVLKQPTSYSFNHQPLSADKRLHKEWDVYLGLRER